MSSIKKVISLLTIVFITIVSCDDNKKEKPISSKEELRITFPLVGGYYYNQTMEKCDYTSEMRYGKSVFSGIFKSKRFFMIMGVIVIVQILLKRLFPMGRI